MGRLPYADKPDDQGGNRNARADNHAGAERRGGDAHVCKRLDALLREAETGERRQIEREQSADVTA